MSGGDTSKETAHYSRIQEEHVKAALRADKGSDAQLNSWIIENFTAKGDNYMTNVSSVKVSYSLYGRDETKSYVVKVNPDRIFEDFKPFVTALFIKETGFYSQVVPALNAEMKAICQEDLRFPRLYFHSLEKGQEVMYLEDMRVKGFRMFDRKKGMDIDHVQMVLKELARLHAASVLLQQRYTNVDLAEIFYFLKLDWDNYAEKAEENFTMVFADPMRSSEEMLHKIGGYESSEKWLREHKTSTLAIFKKAVKRQMPFDLICHGDCWNNNMLFRYSDEGTPVEVMMVDLQLSKMASPATDLTYLMYTSLTGDVRSTNVPTFLSSYYSSFNMVIKAANIPMPFTFQQLQEEYHSKLQYGFLFALLLVMVIVKPDKEFSNRREGSPEDLPKRQAELRGQTLNMMETNPLFKPRFLALFDGMVANGVIV